MRLSFSWRPLQKKVPESPALSSSSSRLIPVSRDRRRPEKCACTFGDEAHRIGRRPLYRPLHAGKLGAQAQRVGSETPMQERFTRSPGLPSRETREGGGSGWLGLVYQARSLCLCLSFSPSPPPAPTPSFLYSALLRFWILYTAPSTDNPSLSQSFPAHHSSPGMAYPRDPPGRLRATEAAAEEPGPWLGCGRQRRE